jgi:hypothetical protein
MSVTFEMAFFLNAAKEKDGSVSDERMAASSASSSEVSGGAIRVGSES